MFSYKVNYILIPLLIGLGIAYILRTLAQNNADSPEEINSGFVFVDWKYLEAPYKIEERDLAIYINGVKVTREDEVEPLKKCCFDYDPGLPEGVPKDATMESIYQEPKVPGGRSSLSAKLGYLFSHYSYEEAYKKAIETYRSFPCVKSLERDHTGWLLECYNGTKSYISIVDPVLYDVNRIYGPGGTGPKPRKFHEKRVEKRLKKVKDALKTNRCFFIITPGRMNSCEEVEAANFLPEVVEVLKSDILSGEEKKGELISLGILSRGSSKTFQIDYSNFEENDQLDERIVALRELVKEKYGSETLHPVERDRDLKHK